MEALPSAIGWDRSFEGSIVSEIRKSADPRSAHLVVATPNRVRMLVEARSEIFETSPHGSRNREPLADDSVVVSTGGGGGGVAACLGRSHPSTTAPDPHGEGTPSSVRWALSSR